jgi:hypothetical protein
MALGTELFQLATSYDPYGAFREGQMEGQKYDIEQQKLDVQQQAMKEAKQEMAAESKPQPLAGMAKSMMPPGTSLETADGIPTSSGLLNQQLVNSQQDLSASQKMMKEANVARAMGDNKAYANLVSEARRLQTTATTNMANARKEYQASIDDALESVYGANSQQEYDQRVKDALTRTGIVPPKNLPEIWTPDVKEKVLSAMSPATRTKVEKEQRAEEKAKRDERTAALRDQRLEALLRNGQGGGGKETPAQTRVIQALTQTSDALQNVANLPITTGPMFQQKQFGSLYTAPLSALNQKLSDESSQMLQTRMTGVARGLAALESGGAATGLVGLTESIEKGTFIQAGSKLDVALDKMGEMRRIVESSAKAMMNDPKLSPERKQLIQDELAIVQKAIPFTQGDIDRARKEAKKNPNMSFTDFTTQKFGGEKQDSVKVGDQTYQRPSNMSDKDWADYKKAVGAQ